MRFSTGWQTWRAIAPRRRRASTPGRCPTPRADPAALKRWFRRCVEVRDATGAERCLLTAVRAGFEPEALADMLFAAATDHRYLSTGHVLDFTNKALEALDIAGWDLAEAVLGSLARGYASAQRMQESNAWRRPHDLVAILDTAFGELPRSSSKRAVARGLTAPR